MTANAGTTFHQHKLQKILKANSTIKKIIKPLIKTYKNKAKNKIK